MAGTLIEKLMNLDRGKVVEVPTSKLVAKRLSEVAGVPLEITVKALSGNIFTEISNSAIGKKNEIDATKVYDTKALIVVQGCVDPDLKNHELQTHYKAATAKELAKILFPGGELLEVANEIAVLSGFAEREENRDETDDKEDVTGSVLGYDNIKN